jgi:2-polyprenyl-3-methyl-5-hydroxy-6-metoxy-1,4-benzoquinol methylase
MILKETQDQRDEELSKLTGVPIEEIKKLSISEPKCGYEEPETEDGYIELYSKDYGLKTIEYMRILMCTSVTKREKELYKLINGTSKKKCLDFGCGVGTHAIALLEKGNSVSILDVPSPLIDLAIKRATLRGLSFDGIYSHDDEIPESRFDVIICTNVLEHVYDPMRDINRITKCLKKHGILHLVVSNKIKPSSRHFKQSVIKWREEGDSFIRKNYIKLEKTIYRKRKRPI